MCIFLLHAIFVLLRGGPTTGEFTPAESVALDQNRGRPMMEGLQGVSATGSATALQTVPFL